MITSSPILKSASSAQMFLIHGLLSQLKINAFPHHFRPQHGKSDLYHYTCQKIYCLAGEWTNFTIDNNKINIINY